MQNIKFRARPLDLKSVKGLRDTSKFENKYNAVLLNSFLQFVTYFQSLEKYHRAVPQSLDNDPREKWTRQSLRVQKEKIM